jgi:two-component system cell cycle sensor histidine kinase PleC
VLRECRRLISERARAAGLALVVEEGEKGTLVCGDATKLRQIVLNLLSNAVKFTPSGGSVNVALGVAGDHAAIVVADSGIGMTTDDIGIALQPFRQIENAYSRKYEGTGLGLPLAKALAELHGGSLAISSTPGQGTRVTITLPLAPEQRELAAA